MSTPKAHPTLEQQPEWIRKASESIAEMYHRGLATVQREGAELHAGAEKAGAAMQVQAKTGKETVHAQAESAQAAMHAHAEKTQATVHAHAEKARTDLAEGAAHAKENLGVTEQKIADIIHKHFQQGR